MTQMTHPPRAGYQVPHWRRTICGLLFLATSINHVDRQVILILKPWLEEIFRWSESDCGWIVFVFQMSYVPMQMVSGHVMDWLGTHLGYASLMVWWSMAAWRQFSARMSSEKLQSPATGSSS